MEPMPHSDDTLNDLPPVLTEAEVVTILRLSRPTIRGMRERLHAVYSGRRVLYPRWAVAAFINGKS